MKSLPGAWFAMGHEVTFIVGGFQGCKQEETINGYGAYGVGNRFTVYFLA